MDSSAQVLLLEVVLKYKYVIIEMMLVWLMFEIVIVWRPRNDGTPLTFSKFEEKKNIEKGHRINTMKRLFWGSPSPPKRQGSPASCVLLIQCSQVHQFKIPVKHLVGLSQGKKKILYIYWVYCKPGRYINF